MELSVRERAFCSLKVYFSLLPPAWRGETGCGAHWGLEGAPGAHRAAGCWPEQGPEKAGGLGSLTEAPWRNKKNKVILYGVLFQSPSGE